MSSAQDHLPSVTMDVCKTMLGLQIDTVAPPSDANQSDVFYAAVDITGDEHLTIGIGACKNAADALTCAMFNRQPSTSPEEDIADAVAEIANMIGGNIKGILGGDCRLSIPEIARELPETDEKAVEFNFDLNGGLMKVTLEPSVQVES